MDELTQLREQLLSQRPDTWENLPDIPLYMDQVVSYLARQMIPSQEEGDGLTSAMINNYIKDGLLARAKGKKYEQEHLAYLIAITALKQVLSVREMHALLTLAQELGDTQKQYDYFCRYLDDALSQTAQELDPNLSPEDLPKLVLASALRSYAHGLACHRLLAVMARQTGREDLLTSKKKK